MGKTGESLSRAGTSELIVDLFFSTRSCQVAAITPAGVPSFQSMCLLPPFATQMTWPSFLSADRAWSKSIVPASAIKASACASPNNVLN